MRTAYFLLFSFLALPHLALGQNFIQPQTTTLGPGTTVQIEYTNDPPSPESLAELRRVQDERAARPKPETPTTPVAPGTVVAGPSGAPTDVAGPNVAPGDYQTFENNVIAAAPNGFRSTVGEISVGAASNILFATGNWYGAISFDHGNNWQWVDPFSQFPAADGGFCCDQEVIYDAARDMMIWILQYSHDGDDNRYRIAVAVGQDDLARGLWTYWDIFPSTVGLSTNRWFDYPHIAISNDDLYLTYNSFRTPDGTGGSTTGIFRTSLDQLAAQGAINIGFWDQSTLFNFTPVQGAGTTMYWASHISTTEIRVYRWSSGPGNIFWDNVTHNAYTSTTRGDGNCPGPDAKDLCVFFDDRVMGGWVSNGRIGFVWIVAQGGGFPFPYTRFIRLNESDRTVIDQPIVWSSNFAWVYPSVGVNSRGHLGGTITAAGGVSIYQLLSTWISDDFNGEALQPLSVFFAASGTDGPQCARWGDYYRSRPHHPYDETWVATGHTLNGGDGAACGAGSSQVTPRVVWFGRERDRPQDDVTISSLWASLDGPYTSGGNSSTGLNPYVPLSQPYCPSPWNYCGGESRNPMPASVVDWGLIRLYAGHPLSPPMTLLAQRAGLVYNDGRVFAATGGVTHFFDNIWGGNYWVAFYHRNHLGVITPQALNFESGSAGHSFRLNGAFGPNAQRASGDGYNLLWGGDANANGSVTSFDFTNHWLPQNGGPAGYWTGDFNMDSNVTSFDFVLVWLAANGLSTNAPVP